MTDGANDRVGHSVKRLRARLSMYIAIGDGLIVGGLACLDVVEDAQFEPWRPQRPGNGVVSMDRQRGDIITYPELILDWHRTGNYY